MNTRSADECARLREGERWDRIVSATCRTVEHDDEVTAAYVVLPRRPGYRDVLRFRLQERPTEIQMTLDKDGGVSISRPRQVATPTPSDMGGGGHHHFACINQPGFTSC